MASKYVEIALADASKFYADAKRCRRQFFKTAPMEGKSFLFERERELRRLHPRATTLDDESVLFRKLSLMKAAHSQLIEACSGGFGKIKGSDSSAVAFAIAIGLPQESVQLLNNLWADALQPDSCLGILHCQHDFWKSDYVQTGCDYWKKGIIDGSGKSIYQVILDPGVNLHAVLLRQSEGKPSPALADAEKAIRADAEKIIRKSGLVMINDGAVGHFEISTNLLSVRKCHSQVIHKIKKLERQGMVLSVDESAHPKVYSVSRLKFFRLELFGSQIAGSGGNAGQGAGAGHLEYLSDKIDSYGLSFGEFAKRFFEHTGKALSEIEPDTISVVLEAKDKCGNASLSRKIIIAPYGEISDREVEIDLERHKLSLIENDMASSGEPVSHEKNIWQDCRKKKK